MVIGLLRLDLRLPACHSLKEKRSVLKRLLNDLRRTHSVAVSETDRQDAWQAAEIAAVTVFSDRTPAERTLEAVAQTVLRTDGVELLAEHHEFL